MGFYHKDKESEAALIRLMDALCMWEREAGRRTTLILFPHEPDEKIVVAQDGKPVNISAPEALNLAVIERMGKTH